MLAVVHWLQEKRKWVSAAYFLDGCRCEIYLSSSQRQATVTRRSGEPELRIECLLGSRLSFTGYPARVPLDFTACRKLGATSRPQNFEVLVQRRRKTSIIVESPVAIVTRMPLEAWWSLRTVAVVIGTVGTNGSEVAKCFTWEERTGQCLKQLVKSDSAAMAGHRWKIRGREGRVYPSKRRQSAVYSHHRGWLWSATGCLTTGVISRKR